MAAEVKSRNVLILRCDTAKCKSPYQDTHYGVGQRVHNLMKKDSGKARCTVCGMERNT